MSILAIIPARAGSKGIPNKNFRPLAGRSPMNRAIDLCNVLVHDGTLTQYYVTSDIDWAGLERWTDESDKSANYRRIGEWIHRPASLAQDDTPMIEVVKHVLQEIPGPPDQQIVLLQPTQPLRTPEHVRKALELLTPEVDSVVSVVEMPAANHPERLCELDRDGDLRPWCWWCECGADDWEDQPQCRQDVSRPAYVRDGTVYAFWRKTVAKDFYGSRCRPFVIPASDTCPLDSMDDWAEAERRLRERSHD